VAPAAGGRDPKRVGPLAAFILAGMSGSVLRLEALRRTVAAQFGLASAFAAMLFVYHALMVVAGYETRR
jgi:hypothetical protein